jgi:hypothetical protein
MDHTQMLSIFKVKEEEEIMLGEHVGSPNQDV